MFPTNNFRAINSTAIVIGVWIPSIYSVWLIQHVNYMMNSASKFKIDEFSKKKWIESVNLVLWIQPVKVTVKFNVINLAC